MRLLISKIFIGLVTTFSLVNINAETYDFVSQNYSTSNGSYTTSMNITGSITTSSAIPPNSTDVDILSLITSFSFNDGVQTIDNTNGFILNPSPLENVDTDGSGNITAVNWFIYPAPEVTSAPVLLNTGIIINTSTVFSLSGPVSQFSCSGPSTASSVCGDGSGSSGAILSVTSTNNTAGWSIRATLPATSPTAVPTLSEWSVIVLIMLLGSVAIRKKMYRV